MIIEDTYIVDRNLKTVVGQLEEIKELLGGSSSGGSMIINITFDIVSEGEFKYTFDKTAGECFEAYSNGIICIAHLEDDTNSSYEIIMSANNLGGNYDFETTNLGQFSADSEHEYPSYTQILN